MCSLIYESCFSDLNDQGDLCLSAISQCTTIWMGCALRRVVRIALWYPFKGVMARLTRQSALMGLC